MGTGRHHSSMAPAQLTSLQDPPEPASVPHQRGDSGPALMSQMAGQSAWVSFLLPPLPPTPSPCRPDHPLQYQNVKELAAQRHWAWCLPPPPSSLAASISAPRMPRSAGCLSLPWSYRCPGGCTQSRDSWKAFRETWSSPSSWNSTRQIRGIHCVDRIRCTRNPVGNSSLVLPQAPHMWATPASQASSEVTMRHPFLKGNRQLQA